MGSHLFDRPPADPGTSLSRIVALIAALLLGGVLIVNQNTGAVKAVFEAAPTIEEQAQSAVKVLPPTVAEPFTLSARFAVQAQGLPRAIAGEPNATMKTLDAWAISPADRVRAAIVAGELLGEAEAIDRLGALNEKLPEGSALRADVADLQRVYTDGPDVLDEATKQRLRTNHGFFGEVALTQGLPDTHPDREPLVTGGGRLFALIMGIGFGLILVFLTGFMLFVTAIVLLSMRKIKSGLGPVEPGGSVFLETFALFSGGFLLLVFGVDLLAGVVQDETWLIVIQILAQWLLLACPLWPLLRGMRWNAYRRAIGWHSGKGVFKEIGCGVVGYLAGLPLLLLGLGITIGMIAMVTLYRVAKGLGEPPPPDSALFDLATSTNPVILIAFFLLATVWAPLCEESIFRGALYRHFRGRSGIVVSAIGSALVFGFAHQYGPVLVFPVVMLGVTFALMREWRGSLIASITAHAMHNATVTLMAFAILRMIS